MSFLINKGATLPAYQRTLLDEDGLAIVLAGTEDVTLQLRRVGTSTTVTRDATIVTAAAGVVKYLWDAADTATGGDYEAVWYVDGVPYPSGGFELVTVYEDDELDADDLVFCTVAQAKSLLRTDFDVDELMFAQTTISIRCGVEASTSVTDPVTPDAVETYYDTLDDQDKLGLRQATAFQAKWLRTQFDITERMNMMSESSDGESREYRGSALMLSPWAEWALNNTRFSSVLHSTIDTPRAGIEDSYEWTRGTDERAWRRWI